MTHVAFKSKYVSCELIHAFIPKKLGTIGRAVVYYARAAHVFSAGIKCRHCSLRIKATFSYSEVKLWSHAMPWNLDGNRACGRVVCPSEGIKCWYRTL